MQLGHELEQELSFDRDIGQLYDSFFVIECLHLIKDLVHAKFGVHTRPLFVCCLLLRVLLLDWLWLLLSRGLLDLAASSPSHDSYLLVLDCLLCFYMLIEDQLLFRADKSYVFLALKICVVEQIWMQS